MAEQPKINPVWVKRGNQARDMGSGEEAFFPLDAMKIDVDHRGWIDPHAVSIDRPVERVKPHDHLKASAESKTHFAAERISTGFRVDLRRLDDHVWEVEEIPDPRRIGGFAWYPVVESLDENK